MTFISIKKINSGCIENICSYISNLINTEGKFLIFSTLDLFLFRHYGGIVLYVHRLYCFKEYQKQRYYYFLSD